MILYCCSARQHICMYGSFIISLPPPAPLSIYLVKSFSFFSTGYIGLIFLSFSPSPSLAYSSWIDGFAAIARVLYSLPDFCVGNGRACNIVHRFGPWLSSAAQYSRMCGDRKSPVLIYGQVVKKALSAANSVDLFPMQQINSANSRDAAEIHPWHMGAYGSVTGKIFCHVKKN